jgi:hypothetical protein
MYGDRAAWRTWIERSDEIRNTTILDAGLGCLVQTTSPGNLGD